MCAGPDFAVNVEQTEEGVAAFGVSHPQPRRAAVGALTVAVPTIRCRRHTRGPLVAQMKRAVREMEVDVADIEP